MKSKHTVSRPNHMRLMKLARQAGCHLSSIGDIESLAGIDTYSETERRELWFKFQHLFAGPTEELFDAVMEHCAGIALFRIDAGQLSLVGAKYSENRLKKAA